MKIGRLKFWYIYLLAFTLSNGLVFAQSSAPPRPVLPPRPILPGQTTPSPTNPRPVAPKQVTPQSSFKPKVVIGGLKNGMSIGGGLNLFYYNMTPKPKYNGSNLDQADSFTGLTTAFKASYIWNSFIFHFDYMTGSLKNGKSSENPKRGSIEIDSVVIFADYLLNSSIIGMRPFIGGGINHFSWKVDGVRGFVTDGLAAEGGLLYPITPQVFSTLYTHLSPFLNSDVTAEDNLGTHNVKITSFQISLGASVNYIF